MTDYTTRKQHSVVTGPWKAHASLQDFDTGATTNLDISQPRTVVQIVSDNRTGSDNPRWRDVIRSGGDATTFFQGGAYSEPFDDYVSATIEGMDMRKADGRLRFQSYKFDGHYEASSYPTFGFPSGPQLADVKNRTIRRFLDSIDSAQSSFEAGQDLGEYKETINSIQKPLHPLKNQILSYLDRLRKIPISKVRDKSTLKKVVADTYLEYHFGWKPLADDVASAIADCGRHRFPVIPVHASASLVYSVGDNIGHSSFPYFPYGYTRSYRDTSTYKLRYKGAVRVKNLLPSGQISWAQSLQLTPDKWLPTIWDLLPYSWMADYFVNIGEIIRGFSALGTNFAWGCVTERNEAKRVYTDYRLDPVTYNPDGPVGNVNMGSSSFGGAGTMTVHSVTRSHLDGTYLVPDLRFSVPSSKYAFANMGAILIQRGSSVSNFLSKVFNSFTK